MKYKREIVIGSRKSNLAKAQTQILIKILRKIGISNIITRYVSTEGDALGSERFKAQGGKGLFTKNIDTLLLNKSIDLGVHSTKDIPAFINNKLKIGAYLKRENPREMLIAKNINIRSLNDLPNSCTLGSSSPRRTCYIKMYRPDIKIIPIRGNINTRINMVRDNKIYATILAAAGIKRIGHLQEGVYVSILPLSTILPAPGQGAIAIMHRTEDKVISKICKLIDDYKTRIAIEAERDVIKNIHGDCFTPIGAYAKIENNNLFVRARLYAKNGSYFAEEKIKMEISKSKGIGKLCAKKILKKLQTKSNRK